MYDHTLHHGIKHFWRYCLEVFQKTEIRKAHVDDCFKVNDEKWLRSLKNVNILDSKIMKGK